MELCFFSLLLTISQPLLLSKSCRSMTFEKIVNSATFCLLLPDSGQNQLQEHATSFSSRPSHSIFASNTFLQKQSFLALVGSWNCLTSNKRISPRWVPVRHTQFRSSYNEGYYHQGYFWEKCFTDVFFADVNN